MNQLALIGIKCAVVLALFGGLYGYGHHEGAKAVQARWDADTAARNAAEAAAKLNRVTENAAIAVKQSETNNRIEAKDEKELAPVRRAIAADRVRVGPAICGGVATPAKAESPAGSDAPDSAGRLVSAELESRIRELEVRVEEALATGRACQQFVRENGMAPAKP